MIYHTFPGHYCVNARQYFVKSNHGHLFSMKNMEGIALLDVSWREMVIIDNNNVQRWELMVSFHLSDIMYKHQYITSMG